MIPQLQPRSGRALNLLPIQVGSIVVVGVALELLVWFRYDKLIFDVPLVGLVVALITLGAVYRQIYIANRQIDLARLEYQAVIEQLDYSRKESILVQQQLRRADLELGFDNHKQTKMFNPDENGDVSFTLNILNHGRTIRDVLLVLYLRTDFDAVIRNMTLDEGTKAGIDGEMWDRYYLTLREPIFENHPNHVFPELTLALGDANMELRYHLVCEDGTFPSREVPGTITFLNGGPIRTITFGKP